MHMLARRDLLKRAALLSGAAALSPLLSACGAGPAAVAGEAAYQYLRTTGLPDHPTGVFPNAHCPMPIEEHDRVLRFSANPVANDDLTPIQSWEFGVACNGVSLDPAGPYWRGDPASGWHFEVMSATASPYLGLDANHAHTQPPSGRYHYHALPGALLERGAADRAKGRMHLLGWAADGFPIYSPYGHVVADDPRSPLVELRSSYRLLSGPRVDGPPGSHDGTFVQDFELVDALGDLDAANSRFGATADFPEGTVYYVFTNAFPFIPRFFRGTPDPSFANPVGPVGNNGLPPELRDYQG
jgi:hypothetical protein